MTWRDPWFDATKSFVESSENKIWRAERRNTGILETLGEILVKVRRREVRPEAHKKLPAPGSRHMSASYLQGGPLAKGLEHWRAYCNPSTPPAISSKA